MKIINPLYFISILTITISCFVSAVAKADAERNWENAKKIKDIMNHGEAKYRSEGFLEFWGDIFTSGFAIIVAIIVVVSLILFLAYLTDQIRYKIYGRAAVFKSDYTKADVTKLKKEEAVAIKNNSIVELMEKRATTASREAKLDLAVSFVRGEYGGEYSIATKTRWTKDSFEIRYELSSTIKGEDRVIVLPKDSDKAKIWIVMAIKDILSCDLTRTKRKNILKKEIFESKSIPEIRQLSEEIIKNDECSELSSFYSEFKERDETKKFHLLKDKIKKNEEGKCTYHLCEQYMTLATYYVQGVVVDKDLGKAAEYFEIAIKHANQLFSEKVKDRKIKEFTARKNKLLEG